MFGVVETESGLRIPVTHRAPIQAVAGAQTADGRGLIVTAGGDGMIRSWDATSGSAAGFRAPLPDTRIGFLGVAEAGGTRLVVCADHNAVRRFDLESGNEVGDPLRAPGAGWLPVGGLGPAAMLTGLDTVLLVAGAVGGQVCRWDAATGEPTGQSWTGDTGTLLAITVLRLRDGRAVIVTGNNDGVVQRWEAATGEPIGAALRGHHRPVTALTWATGDDGRDVLIAQEFRGPLHRWDAATGEPLGVLPHQARGVSEGGLAVTPDGRVLFSVDQSGAAWHWDLTRPDPVAERLAVTATAVNAVAVVPCAQGWLGVTGDEKGRLRRWDTAGRPVGDDLLGHPASIQDLLAVPASSASGGRTILVSAGRDGARCWNVATGEPAGDPLAPLPVGNGLAAVWLPDARLILATGTQDGIDRVNALTGADTAVDPTDETIVWDVAAGTLPDGRPFFAAGSEDGSVYLLDAATGETRRPPLHDLASQILAVAVTTLPGGAVMLAAGGEDRTILRWDAAVGERIGAPLMVGEWSVVRLAFHALPDGGTLLVAVDDAGTVYRWDAVTGESVGEPLPADGDPETPPRLDDVVPAHVIAVSHEEVVRCWDVLTGRHLGDITDAQSAVTATLPDGRVVLAVGHLDGSLTVTPLPASS